MMAYFQIDPAGSFWARLDTIGTTETELANLSPITPQNLTRIAMIRENMRCAFESLSGILPTGRG